MSGTDAGQPGIDFATDTVADKAIIHDNDTCQLQWAAFRRIIPPQGIHSAAYAITLTMSGGHNDQ